VVKKVTFEDIDPPAPGKGKKSVTEPEVAEEKSFWDENHNEQNKKPLIEEVEDEPQTGKKTVTKPEVVEEVPADETLTSPKRGSVKKDSVKEEPLSAGTEGIPLLNALSFSLQFGEQLLVSENSTFSHTVACR
jgi:hypothetical protein